MVDGPSLTPSTIQTGQIAWSDEAWAITLDVANGSIAKAAITWQDPAADAAFLATLCRCLVGMSLREARDHGVQYANPTEPGAAKHIQGIVMPMNYSVTSRAAEKALRTAIDQVAPPDPAQWNFEDRGLSAAWRKLPVDERRRRLDELLAAALKSAGSPDAATVESIDQHDRVLLQFAPDFPVKAKPPLLMQLERHIRKATGERFEVFVSEMKDNNRIRRL